MTKHQPATPLPQLFYTTGALRKDSDAYDVFAIGDVTVYSDIKIGNFTEEQIAAYIAHAANAYPRLVAALHEVRLIAEAVDRDDESVPVAYRAKTLADAVEVANALLCELGEDV